MTWKLALQSFLLLLEGIAIGMLIEYYSPTIHAILITIKPVILERAI